MCLGHTLRVQRLRDNARKVPAPPPQFPIHKIGLTSPFPELCGDPREVIDRRECCKLDRGQRRWVLGAVTGPRKVLEAGLIARGDYEGHDLTEQARRVPEACRSPQGNV